VMEEIGALAFVKSVQRSGEDVTVELDDLKWTGDVVRFLAAQGADIYKVEPVHRSLEEVFLELVGEEQSGKNEKCKMQYAVRKGVGYFGFLRTGLASGSAVGNGTSASGAEVVGECAPVCGYDHYDDGGRCDAGGRQSVLASGAFG